METLRKWLSEYPEAHILDVATGTGAFLGLMMETGSLIGRSMGIDCSERAIQNARHGSIDFPNFRFETMDASQMNFPDATWDIVTMAKSLHHLPNRRKVLHEMERVLRPGGIIIIQEMVADGLTAPQLSHRKFHHLSAEIDRTLGICHRPTYTRAEICSWIREHSSLALADEWVMKFPPAEKPNQVEIESLFSMMDRMVDRVLDDQKKSLFVAKARRIRSYIEKHGCDSCPELMLVLKK